MPPKRKSLARTPRATSTVRRPKQEEFFAQLAPTQPFRELFAHVPGAFFFAKDAQSRMMCGSPALVQRLGVKSEQELIGRPDSDFFPAQIADRFRTDDLLVLRTGKPLLHRVEIFYNEFRVLDWFVTTKLPLFNQAGRAVGVMGVVQSYEGRRKALAIYGELARVVDHIRDHLREGLAVADLARLAGLSERQFQRKFRAAFRLSVQQFIVKARIQHAADTLLKSSRTIADIAAEYGFCDQSAFTQQFRQHTGLTPLKYRKRYWK